MKFEEKVAEIYNSLSYAHKLVPIINQELQKTIGVIAYFGGYDLTVYNTKGEFCGVFPIKHYDTVVLDSEVNTAIKEYQNKLSNKPYLTKPIKNYFFNIEPESVNSKKKNYSIEIIKNHYNKDGNEVYIFKDKDERDLVFDLLQSYYDGARYSENVFEDRETHIRYRKF